MWQTIDSGKTIGRHGSENGIIITDEEFKDLARITLEKDTKIAPWSFTCGIYGMFFHTAYFSNEKIAKESIDSAKKELEEIMKNDNNKDNYRLLQIFTEKY